jgi:hypothetical protein
MANVTKHCPPYGMDGESNGENVGENVIHSAARWLARRKFGGCLFRRMLAWKRAGVDFLSMNFARSEFRVFYRSRDSPPASSPAHVATGALVESQFFAGCDYVPMLTKAMKLELQKEARGFSEFFYFWPHD